MVSLPECAVQNGYMTPLGRQDFRPYTIPTDITLGYNLTFPANGYLTLIFALSDEGRPVICDGHL